jgi:flagellar biosynthesis GTPase FlhF
MTRTTSTQITKPESNTRHCRDQEVAQGSDKQNSTANRQTTEVKPFMVEESLSKNKQHSCKAKKQEVEQQEHKTVQNQEKHQGVKL